MFISNRGFGKQKVINDAVDNAVLGGQHVHTIGPDGKKCYGGFCEDDPNFGKPPKTQVHIEIIEIDEWEGNC